MDFVSKDGVIHVMPLTELRATDGVLLIFMFGIGIFVMV